MSRINQLLIGELMLTLCIHVLSCIKATRLMQIFYVTNYATNRIFNTK